MKNINVEDQILNDIEEEKDYLIIGLHAKLDMLLDYIEDLKYKIDNIESKLNSTNTIESKINLWKNTWK